MFGWNKLAQRKQPDAEWIAEACQKCPYTPDLVWLTRSHFQLLFVYGTQQRGHPQHELVMHHGAYAATAFTDNKFSLWKKRLGNESFPIALEGSGWRRPDWAIPAAGRVQGELYAIKTEQLIELDNHYQNTLEFKRKRVKLLIPYRKLYRIEAPLSDVQKTINEPLGIKDQVVTTENGVELVEAYMYIGHPTFWDNQLEYFFAPVELYKPNRLGWLGDYYSFTKAEYGK